MKLDDKGNLVVSIEELIESEEVLKACAKHAVFNRYLLTGIVEMMLRDEADWNGEEDTPWSCFVSFGRSYIEEARQKLIAHADEAAQTAVRKLTEERDTYKRYYEEEGSKLSSAEAAIRNLKARIVEMQKAGER